MTIQLNSLRVLGYPLLALGLSLAVAACGSKVQTEAPSSSQTHWLKACQVSAECGSLACIASVCTKECSGTEACSDLSVTAVCRNHACDKQSPEQPSPSGPSSSATPEKLPAGAPCSDATECRSTVCEGQGCAEKQGRCADENRACTTDDLPYCGCDGKSFTGSGSCPRARYEHTGECKVADKLPPGSACNLSSECKSGICEGQGCAEKQGTCADEDKACTADARPYCGCDGKTFTGSGSCPGARYSARGACEDSGGALKADGSRCNTGNECQSGRCEGQGCGDLEGVCQAQRDCPPVVTTFCGCDGKTFEGGHPACPGGRYAHEGACTSN